MILWIAEMMYNLVAQRAVKQVTRMMERLYPDPEDRAAAYLAEGAQIIETMQFGEGELLHSITMYPTEDGGYFIEALTPEEITE